MSMPNKSMKIMTLGYSNVGKTYFLGSLFTICVPTGQQGFSIQNKRFQDLGRFQDIYETVTEKKEGAIGSSMGLQSVTMELKKGIASVLDLEITDIEGQALEPGRSIGTAQEILEKIVGYDGLILLLEAPGNKLQAKTANGQLTQMMLFAGEVLKVNQGIPVTLVINKIDALPEAQGLSENIKQADIDLKNKYPNDRKAFKQAVRSQRGEIVGSIVKPIIDTDEIDDILATFFKWVKGEMQIPNRVFLCTSLGFDNIKVNEADSSTFVAKLEDIEPYGSVAAFLWTIYARLKAQNSKSGLKKFLDGDPIANNLLEDIKELHTSGKAFFDNSAELWSLRNIGNLYSDKLYGG